MALFDTKHALQIHANGFTQWRSLFDKVKVKWTDISKAEGVKRDLITYQDNLIVLTTPRRQITISEIDKNFKIFEPVLRRELNGFPPNWYELTDAQALEQPIILWERQ